MTRRERDDVTAHAVLELIRSIADVDEPTYPPIPRSPEHDRAMASLYGPGWRDVILHRMGAA